ncbi:hypothetical protein AYO21_05518 [Fonsecaea monophora]|uniref:BTB domain-containing protein n=1 Tax=Fonsecaea monophora TaxID=254056 RepID=A0A177F7M5_9EURO|nr:hypothetical protein AYO21_05518 [Fonsecaea monophora]OAG40235.1 hypothetical protein AYO21_05518 [Fonsecaea monophora]
MDMDDTDSPSIQGQASSSAIMDTHDSDALSTQGQASSTATLGGGEIQNFTNSPIITISVGKEKTTFRIHKDRLTADSVFFNKMLASSMAESQTNEVSLPDDSPKIFGEFAVWIYQRAVKHHSHNNHLMIMKCWILGDKYGVPQWQDQLIEDLAGLWREPFRFRFDELSWVLENVRRGSALFRFVMDLFAWKLRQFPDKYFANGNVAEEVSQVFSRHDFPLSAFLVSAFPLKGHFCRPPDWIDPYLVRNEGKFVPLHIQKLREKRPRPHEV